MLTKGCGHCNSEAESVGIAISGPGARGAAIDCSPERDNSTTKVTFYYFCGCLGLLRLNEFVTKRFSCFPLPG